MLTKIITTAIAVVVLAAPTSAFYEACFYSDNECTTKVDCLTADEYAEAVTPDDAPDDDYGPNNMTSCDDYFDMYNAQDHDHDFTMNVTVFESCRKNVSPCSLQCKGTALSTACIADCDTKCAECSTSKEASQEETCKSYHCPSTIPGTTTKYLSSQADCLTLPTAGGGDSAGIINVENVKVETVVVPTKPATLSFEVDLGDIDLSTATATELAAAKKDAIAVAQKAGKYNSDDVSKVVFTQNGVEIDSTRRRRANVNGPITITIVFKADADVNMDAVLTSLNAAIAAGSVSLEVTIDGEVVTGAVTKAATGVAAVGAGAATVSAKMVTALAALTVGVAAAW